ncbi:flagellar biosynthetic protein FliO [Rhizobium sp. AAP43]|uniref:flagellar biosynthetic protein FliO n=1 Tax=Rhizobium sp. AAP43 TaxID=1523420 RepID=UPI0006B914C2|nr:flagellar biosynthetic protein FliO [Rhizobium sp. AAP43]
MVDELISAYGDNFMVAALGVALGLLCLFIVLWLLRNRAPSPFVRGGRNRQPRLQVLDAAAVDTRRRIVLIRRDNVEHLVMIGGPTDIVIESGIGDDRAYLSTVAVQASERETIPAKSVAEPVLVAPTERPLPVMPAIAETTPKAEADPAPNASPTPEMLQPPIQVERRGQPAAPAMRAPDVTPQSAPMFASTEAPRQVRMETPVAAPVVAKAMTKPVEPSPTPAVDVGTLRAEERTPRSTSQPTNFASEQLVPPVTATAAQADIAPLAAAFSAATATAGPVMAMATTLPEKVEPVATIAPPMAPIMPAAQIPTFSTSATSHPRAEIAINARDDRAGTIDQAAIPDIRPEISATEETAPQIEAPQAPSSLREPVFSLDHSVEPEFAAPVVTVEPVSDERDELEHLSAARPLPQRTEPTLESAPLKTEIPDVEAVLEAARQKVLAPEPRREPRPFEAERFTSKTVTPFAAAAAEEPKRDISEFERVLEEEMALHLAASPTPGPAAAGPRPAVSQVVPDVLTETPRLPMDLILGERRQNAVDDSKLTPDAESANEPSLQNEIARIFGEMSASRNP